MDTHFNCASGSLFLRPPGSPDGSTLSAVRFRYGFGLSTRVHLLGSLHERVSGPLQFEELRHLLSPPLCFDCLAPCRRRCRYIPVLLELMSILSYLLVNYKHEDEYNTQAGYLMLAMSEAGTLAAALALLLLAGTSGKLDFASLKAASTGMSESVRWAVFLLSFLALASKLVWCRATSGFRAPIRRRREMCRRFYPV